MSAQSSLAADKLVGNLKSAANPPPPPPTPLSPARAAHAKALHAAEAVFATIAELDAPIKAGRAAQRVLASAKDNVMDGETVTLSARIQAWLRDGGRGDLPAPSPQALAAHQDAAQAVEVAKIQGAALDAHLAELQASVDEAMKLVAPAQAAAQNSLRICLEEEAAIATAALDAADAARRTAAAKLDGLRRVIGKLPNGIQPAERIRRRLDSNPLKLDPITKHDPNAKPEATTAFWCARWGEYSDRLANDPTATLEESL